MYEVTSQFVTTIEKTFATSGEADLDDLGEAVLVPSVVILTLLVEHLKATPPPPALIAIWKEKYLAIFDGQIDELAPKGSFKVERRNVIESTFLKLEELARKRA